MAEDESSLGSDAVEQIRGEKRLTYVSTRTRSVPVYGESGTQEQIQNYSSYVRVSLRRAIHDELMRVLGSNVCGDRWVDKVRRLVVLGKCVFLLGQNAKCTFTSSDSDCQTRL